MWMGDLTERKKMALAGVLYETMTAIREHLLEAIVQEVSSGQHLEETLIS